MSQKNKKPTFEEATERLEGILESMEGGDTPLAELIAKFEEGSLLLRNCQKELQSAELKIEKLNTETGHPEPFENNDNDA